ncbi:caspase domain-containing protein [Mycena capillaripes]|nr:caspase domain-containing protein [Mycena capillaripes]
MDVGGQCRGHPAQAHDSQLECRDQLSAASFSLDHCTGQKKALLIGISNARSEGYPELTGAHGDVKKIYGLLLEKYHYTPSQITTLLDDGIPGHVQPTRDNILAAIAEFVKDVKEGDHLFFHYSGHSTQVPNPNPRSMSEEDGKDECLVPLDGEEKMIVDNELHAALVQPLPAGSHLVAVLDTCHSGSLLDLKHYRCNRAFVPWTWRGRRNSEEIRSKVVRRGAHLLTLSQTGGALQTQAPKTVTPTSPARATTTRRSIISVVCDPPASSAPSSRTSTGLSRTGTGLAKGPGTLARLRTAVARTRTMSVDKDKDKENLTEGDVGPVLPAISKLSWILPDEELHCDSPVGQFPCNGWCRNVDGRATLVDGEDDVKADVISLASCKDSQIAWEADGISMTSSLVELLTENPHRSLKDVLLHISHATHSLAVMRHGRSQAYKRKRKAYTAFLVRTIARLERGNRSTASLAMPDTVPDIDTLPAHPTLAVRPTFPVCAKPGLVRRVGEHVVWLKQRLKEARKAGGFDIDNFQNPEMASPRPLDMSRPWRM